MIWSLNDEVNRAGWALFVMVLLQIAATTRLAVLILVQNAATTRLDVLILVEIAAARSAGVSGWIWNCSEGLELSIIIIIIIITNAWWLIGLLLLE
jgi:hypothetical protein